MVKTKTIFLISLVVVTLTAAVTISIIFGVPGILSNFVTVNSAKLGKIVGKGVNLEDGQVVYEFYNIPYAVPPVGRRRFQAAEICTGSKCWKGSKYDATNNTPVKCIQTWNMGDVVGESEDCLKLTVRSTNLAASKPVVVWIHGGGLVFGWGEQMGYSFDAQSTRDLDVVTVNINYRLGYLGFNAWEETWNTSSGMYANNGIRDQIIALKWVNENIADFGGDPNAVTILGESGGGSAILGLVSSPLANDLFQNAWSMSPAAEIRFDYKKADKETPKLQAGIPDTLGCTQDTLEERRDCLFGLDASRFTSVALPQTYSLGRGWMDFPLRWDATFSEYIGMLYTDPTVITQSPRDLKDATYIPSTKVKVILSNTKAEAAVQSSIPQLGSPVATSLFPNMTYLKSSLTELYQNMTDNPDIVETTVNTLYPGMSSQLVWDTLVTDLRQTCPNNEIANAMSLSSNHEIYRLYISNAMHEADSPSFHMWDIIALFGFKYFPYQPSKRDLMFQTELRSILKKLVYGKVDKNWGTFPTRTMEIGNSKPLSVISSNPPQDRVCDVFRSLDLLKYGVQN